MRWADYPAAAARFAAVSPRFGPAVAVGLSCANWAAPPDPTSPPTATGAPPILVVSTTGDPATPYEWGVAVARQLPGAALLTFDGEGHTAYSRRRSLRRQRR
ncbi:MAG: alpha/beta hydrolase [Thermoflexaceae bacterium]|nr:alpha/beta hydrolase [Thermoflexaceae bacterium]